MAGRIDVGVGRTVVVDLELVSREVAIDLHIHTEPLRRIRRLLGEEVMGQRVDRACFNQCRRLHPLRRGNEVEGAELVVWPSTAPVRKLGHPSIELFLGCAVGVFLWGALPLLSLARLRRLGRSLCSTSLSQGRTG